MNSATGPYFDFWGANRAVLRRYLIAAPVVIAAVLGYFLIEENYRYLTLVVAPTVFLLAISFPRFAVYQFIVMLFSGALLSRNPVVLYVDLSAFVLACAALLDFLLRDTAVPERFPRFTINFVLLMAGFFVCAVAGYNFGLVAKPMARVMVMAVTFLSLYRLSRYFTVRHLVIFFFWVGVINALIAIGPVISGDNVERVFGLAWKAQDDLMMVSLPIGLLLFIWSSGRKGLPYLGGFGIIIVSLLAAQTRFPILFSAAISLLAIVISLVIARKRASVGQPGDPSDSVSYRTVKRRIVTALAVSVVPAAFAAVLRPAIAHALYFRFGMLISGDITGTAELRLYLWQTALKVFWDNPLLGIGPGNFEIVHSIYRQFHLNPAEIYVRGASAHNLFLQYLAETGVVGATFLLALMVNQFRLSWRSMRSQMLATRPEISLALFSVAALFLGTTFVEAGWMWGQTSFLFVFFLALIARFHERVAPKS